MPAPVSVESAVASRDQAVEIVGHGEELWKVKILFPGPGIPDREMVARLREAKRIISGRFNVPTELLEFRELLEKSVSTDGIEALVAIGTIKVGESKPIVRLKPMETPRGDVLPDMIAELDFNYLDDFRRPISLERIKIELIKEGVDLRLCNFEKVQKAIERAKDCKSFVKNLVVAWGRLPDVGLDAELEYAFFTQPDAAANLAEYQASRKVREGDIVCQKVPARDGKKSGHDVRGRNIPPIKGLDFELVAGEGTRLSVDRTRLAVLRDGVPLMDRTTRRLVTLDGDQLVLDKIIVKVKPLIELNAEDILSIAMEDSVEIQGNLRWGSSIVTEGEVYLKGHLERGAKITAGSDVLIEGQIRGGEISSEHSVYSSDGARNSKILAAGDVNLVGLVEKSEISGRKVKAGSLKGAYVEAGQKVTIKDAGNDASGRKTTIRVGRDDYYRRKLEANQATIDTLSAYVERIREVFGPEIVGRLGGANQQQLLVEFIKRLHARGITELGGSIIESLRELLQSIRPLQNVIAEKSEEMETLTQKASDEHARRPVVVIREKIRDPVDIIIDDKTKTIGPTEGGSAITTSPEGDIRTFHLLEPSSRKSIPKLPAPHKKKGKRSR